MSCPEYNSGLFIKNRRVGALVKVSLIMSVQGGDRAEWRAPRAFGLRGSSWVGLILLLLIAPAFAATHLEGLAGYEGEWQRISPDEDASRLDAIDTAVADLPWLMRKVAGPALRRQAVPPPGYVFELQSDGLAMARIDRELRRLALDNVERQFETERGTVTLSSLQLQDAIQTRWKTPNAEGSNTFRLVDGGSTLLVEYMMQITAISGIDRIRYQARFAQKTQ